MRFILARCLNMTSIMGLLIGKRNKQVGWVIVALISSCIHLGMLLGYYFRDKDTETEYDY